MGMVDDILRSNEIKNKGTERRDVIRLFIDDDKGMAGISVNGSTRDVFDAMTALMQAVVENDTVRQAFTFAIAAVGTLMDGEEDQDA